MNKILNVHNTESQHIQVLTLVKYVLQYDYVHVGPMSP